MVLATCWENKNEDGIRMQKNNKKELEKGTIGNEQRKDSRKRELHDLVSTWDGGKDAQRDNNYLSIEYQDKKDKKKN